jgi:hypothetical protein
VVAPPLDSSGTWFRFGGGYVVVITGFQDTGNEWKCERGRGTGSLFFFVCAVGVGQRRKGKMWDCESDMLAIMDRQIRHNIIGFFLARYTPFLHHLIGSS